MKELNKRLHINDETSGIIILKDKQSENLTHVDINHDVERIRYEDIEASRDIQHVAILSSN